MSHAAPQPFAPNDFYTLAVALPTFGTGESYLRTAIGRAYYACFHVARIACHRKWSWSAPASGQHRAVVRELREHRLLYHAAALQMLLDLREHADYILDKPVDEALCRHALNMAAGLLPRLRSL